nr:T cell receptor alpha variable 18 [Myotis myotis]
MLSPSCLGLVILLILRGTSGASVSQTEGLVTLIEGAFLTLNCTYQTTYSNFLFWYVQYGNKEPILLLKSSSDNQEMSNRGFLASLVKTDSSFHLKKPSVQMSDSAVYYCAMSDTVREAAGGAEHKPRGTHMGLKGTSLVILEATLNVGVCYQET